MTDSELMTSEPLMSYAPEPLTCSEEAPMMSVMPTSSESPAYLSGPESGDHRSSGAAGSRRRGRRRTRSTDRARTEPDRSRNPAEARRRYYERLTSTYRPTDAPNISLAPEGVMSCDPANMSCPEPVTSAAPLSSNAETASEGEMDSSANANGSGEGVSSDSVSATEEGVDAESERRASGQPSQAEERERKFQEAQEDRALALPFVPLPVPESDTTSKRLSPLFLQVGQGTPPLDMPQQLDARPEGKAANIPQHLTNYETHFSETRRTASGLYEQIVGEGREQLAAMSLLLSDVQSQSQRNLDSNLDEIDAQLAEELETVAAGENAAIHRLELIADTARMLVKTAASRALGTVAARKRVIENRISLAQSASLDNENLLAGFYDTVQTAGTNATNAFNALSSDPAPARFPRGAVPEDKYRPAMTAAMNEAPLDNVISARATNRSAAFTNGARVFGQRLTDAHQAYQRNATGAFQPFQSYIDMLATTAPRQIRKLKTDALKTIDRMEKRAKRTILESRNRSEINLVERHRLARNQIVSQAQSNAAGQQRAIERNAIGQARSFAGLAMAQGSTIKALKQQIAAQRMMSGENFARYVIQASKRTAEKAIDAAESRQAMMSGTGQKMREAMDARHNLVLIAQSGSAKKLQAQINEASRQAAAEMMRNMLAQEMTMRQSAEPVAKSVDSFVIPAASELDEMESALWDALGEARDQANAAYYGGGPEGEGGEGGAQESPPPGTGSLPSEFVTTADQHTTAPADEGQMVDLLSHIGGTVRNDVATRGEGLIGQMSLLNQNPEQTLGHVRGLTYLRGQAVINYYNVEKPGNLLDDIALYMSFGNLASGFNTRVYSGEAVYNYLYGNRAKGALLEVQAATEWSNNADQAMAAMEALSPADMAALRDLPGAEGILNSVEEDLGGTDARAFNLLRNATEENAPEMVAAARSVRLSDRVESDLQNDPETGADAAFDHMESVARTAGTSRLEGHNEFGLTMAPEPRTGADAVSRADDPAPLPADYRFETREEVDARRAELWGETVARLGNDGIRREDGRVGGVAWLTSTMSRDRWYGDGEYSYQARARQEQIDLVTELANNGPDHPRVRARQLIVEETRRGGAKRERVEHALQDDAGNAGLLNPDDPEAATSHDGRPSELERAQQREAEMYHFYDSFRNHPGADPADVPRRDMSVVRAELGGRLRANASDERLGRLLERQVVNGLTDPATAALAFEHAVDRWGTDESLLRDTFRRMSREQIEAAVAEYDSTHDPGLYERLGIFGEGQGTFDWPELSGDDRMEIQILAMGRPRNDRERLQVSRMTSKLQMDNSTFVGRWMAGSEYRRLERSHARILNLTGVTDADFDRFGALRRPRDGSRLGNFDSRGRFRAVARDAAGNTRPGAAFESILFESALSTNETRAEAYKVAIDNIANAITTAIIVATAIITTAVTFGGAASIWIPMAITATGGLMAMAVNATLKGGRYGYEDAFRDLGMTIVQTATAGLAAGLNIGATGGMSAVRTALTSRMVNLAGKAGPSLFTEAMIGGATGALGGAGNALFDDQAWDRGEWLSGIGHGAIRGFGGGFAAGAVTGATMRGLRFGAEGAGRFMGMRNALANGKTGFAAARAAVLNGRNAASSFGLNLAGRTIGGGLGGAASRAVEISYDRGRGKYQGSYAQAMDEVYSAGLQNAIQSLGEGVAEHGMQNSAAARNWQRRQIGAFIIPDDHNNIVAINRRPAANDNSDPALRALWARHDAGDASADRALRSANPLSRATTRPPVAGEVTPDSVEGAVRPARPANDNVDGATPVSTDRDGNITTLARTGETEPIFASRSPLNEDPDFQITPRRAGADNDDGPVMRTFDPEDTQPIRRDAIEEALQKQAADEFELQRKQQAEEIKQRFATEQALPPRTFKEQIDARDGGLRRIFDTIDLTARDIQHLGMMPENSRIKASNPHDLDAAMHNYKLLMEADRNREVLLVRNRETGEYMVVQGGPTSVSVPHGPYIIERHSHPRIISSDLEAVLVRSLPSGKDGDIGAVLHETDSLVGLHPPGTIISRSSTIDIQVADANGNIVTRETHFGIIRQGDEVRIWVEFHDPVRGNTVRRGFTNIAEYEGYVFKLTGVDLTKQAPDAVKAINIDNRGESRSTARHGDSLSASEREAIDFFRPRTGRSEEAEIAALRNEFDPARGASDAVQEAHLRVQRLGLVGEPDSMIRLHNIINDESIPIAVRSLISDVTLEATRQHLVRTGQLNADEPLIMLFHGAASARARQLVETGIDMARRPGGTMDDFGEGIYFTRHLDSAMVYAKGRGGTARGDTNGAVIPYLLRGRELGPSVDVTTGGAQRAGWEAFVSANSALFDTLRIDPDYLRRPGVMQAMIRGEPLPFGTFDGEARGKVFNAFLESLGGNQRRPDIIFGDLGGPLTSGVQYRGGVTDQAAIRSQRLADILNEQHVRRPAAEDAPVMRSVVAPPDAASKRPAEPDAMERLTSGMIRGLAVRDTPEGVILRNLLRLAPETVSGFFADTARNMRRGREIRLPESVLMSMTLEMRSKGVPPDIAEVMRQNLGRLLQPENPVLLTLAETAAWSDFHVGLSPRLNAAIEANAARAIAERYGYRNATSPDRQLVRRLMQQNPDAVVEMINGEGSLRSRALRYAHARIAEGEDPATAFRDGFALRRAMLDENFVKVETDVRRKLARANVSGRELAELVRQRPDRLLYLAHSNPDQLAQLYADLVMRRVLSGGSKYRPPSADRFANNVQNRMRSNFLPIVSEATSVAFNMREMGLTLLKSDAVNAGGANRPGLDIVGFSPLRGADASTGGPVRVVVMDDKAYRMNDAQGINELTSVSAMTGPRLGENLASTAAEIRLQLNALQSVPGLMLDPAYRSYFEGANAAIRQMEAAAADIARLRVPKDANALQRTMRSFIYAKALARILERHNIVLVVSSSYGNVNHLSQWLRWQGFILEEEYRRRRQIEEAFDRPDD